MRFLFNLILKQMRNSAFTDLIFDTRVDTQKIYVPMNYRFNLHNHVDRRGKSLMYLHITQDGERDKIPLENVKIERKHWDMEKQRAKRTAVDQPEFNLVLENFEKKITQIKTYYHLNELHLTLERFKTEFLNLLSRTDFLAFMKQTLDDRKDTMVKGTHTNQMKVWRKLKKYQDTVMFYDITMNFLGKYKSWLITGGLALTSANAHMKVIKKFLNEATKSGIKLPIDTKNIICGTTNGNRVDLDGEEVDRLAEYFVSRFIRPNHKQPLGLFLLACFTGLRISDAQQLTSYNIHQGRIIFTSQKSQKRQIVKINLTVEGIMSHCPEVLTQKHSDQHVNRMLKQICKNVGITKEVTFHVARHTFATNYLRLGGTVQVLQKILGHSDINETMIYVHIVQEEQDRGMDIMDNMITNTHFSHLLSSESA